MANYGHIIFFSLIGGLFSLIGGLFLLSRKGSAEKLAHYATPFAAGALLAAVFLDLLKEGLEISSTETVLFSALVGILLFFLAERFLHWFHHHHQHDGHGDPTRSLIVIGDTAHNILDGVAIAAAFLISVPTGIVTTFAVAAHEIPQEIGDFGLLLHKGMRRRNVLLVNILSALATTVAAVLTFALGTSDRLPLGVLLGLSAGFLLYISLSDVIPELHERTSNKRLFSLQPVLLLLGVLVVGLAITVSHRYIHAGHEGHDHDHGTTLHVHDDEEHELYEITDYDMLPSFKLTLTTDTKEGYNIHLDTENFKFAPEKAGTSPVDIQGHAHLYVNGRKVMRLYAPDAYLPELKVGDKVEVRLSTNDHRDIAHAGEPIAARITVLDMPSQSVKNTFSHSHSD